MLEAEHQFVASEIMSFSRALQTPERRPTFEKAISMDVHCMQEQKFAEESRYFRLTILFSFRESK